MLRSNFLLAWRNLLKNRTSSFVNIGGLAVGIAVALLTGLWLHDELSFNTYHKNYDRIAKVSYQGTGPNGVWLSSTLSYPLVNTLTEQYKDVFKRLVRASWTGSKILSAGEKKISCPGQYMDEGAQEPVLAKDAQGRPRWVDGPAFHSSFGSHRQVPCLGIRIRSTGPW